MRTLVLYKRDNEQYGCIVDHHESIDFSESEEARDAIEDHITSDKNSVFYVELPDNTFRPAVFDQYGDECGVMFFEMPEGCLDKE